MFRISAGSAAIGAFLILTAMGGGDAYGGETPRAAADMLQAVTGHWKGEWRGQVRSGDVWISIRSSRSEITVTNPGTGTSSWEVTFEPVISDKEKFNLVSVRNPTLVYRCGMAENRTKMVCDVMRGETLLSGATLTRN